VSKSPRTPPASTARIHGDHAEGLVREFQREVAGDQRGRRAADDVDAAEVEPLDDLAQVPHVVVEAHVVFRSRRPALVAEVVAHDSVLLRQPRGEVLPQRSDDEVVVDEDDRRSVFGTPNLIVQLGPVRHLQGLAVGVRDVIGLDIFQIHGPPCPSLAHASSRSSKSGYGG
jgi:hypothetical protein